MLAILDFFSAVIKFDCMTSVNCSDWVLASRTLTILQGAFAENIHTHPLKRVKLESLKMSIGRVKPITLCGQGLQLICSNPKKWKLLVHLCSLYSIRFRYEFIQSVFDLFLFGRCLMGL